MSHGKTLDIGGVPHKTILASGNLIGPSRAGVLLPMPYGKALARWDASIMPAQSPTDDSVLLLLQTRF